MAVSRFSFPAAMIPARRFARGERGYVVRFRDLPEAITQGDSLADALIQSIDCLDEAIAARIANEEDIPTPSRVAKGERMIALPAQMSAKAGLYLAMRTAGISQAELARRLNCDEKDVRRLLDPRYGSKLPKIDAALAVLGKRLEIVVRNAA
jgi:antitoxin HicB